MAQRFSNKARSQLITAISAADTSFSVLATDADLFPTANVGTGTVPSTSGNWFKVVIEDDNGYEIVYVRTRSTGSNVFSNVLRGQEGTTAKSFPAGSIVGLRVTAQDAETAAQVVNLQAQVASLASSKLDVAAPSFGGNAATATKLQTARTFTIGNTGKSVDGSSNVSWSLAEIGAAAATHTHTISNVTGLQAELDRKAIYSPEVPAATLQNNTTLPAGFYTTSGGLLNPNGTTVVYPGWHHVINLRHGRGDGYAAQIAISYAHNGHNIYFREALGSNWTQWYKVWYEDSFITKAVSPSNINNSATLTTTALKNHIITGTPATNITYTLPTGNSLDAAGLNLQINHSFEWSVINLASTSRTITVAGNTNHTVVGNRIVQPNTSGRFLTRKTAANTFVTYRIA